MLFRFPRYISPIPTDLHEIAVVSGDTYSPDIDRAVALSLEVPPSVPSNSTWIVEVERSGVWTTVGTATLSIGGEYVAWYPGLLDSADWIPARSDARAVAVLPGGERWTHVQFTLTVTA